MVKNKEKYYVKMWKWLLIVARECISRKKKVHVSYTKILGFLNKKLKLKLKMARLIKTTPICDAYLITTIIQFYN